MNKTNSEVTFVKRIDPFTFGKIVALDDGWYTDGKLKKFKIKYEDGGMFLTIGKSMYCFWFKGSLKGES